MDSSFQRVFKYKEKPIRTRVVEGEIYFVAKDVCSILEINFYRNAITRLEDDERGWVIINTLGDIQKLAAVNEYGLYNLILHSWKPEAKTFKRWVTHEVLPAIRKTGQTFNPTACWRAGHNPKPCSCK